MSTETSDMASVTNEDFVVIGGGPAGSTVATLLADAGHSVLLLEAAKFPRFTVGEIIAPTALWRVWHRIGITREKLDELYIRKFNGAWEAPDGTVFQFEQDVHPEDSRCQAFVYSLERSTYDNMLLENARSHGVNALEEAFVQDVLLDESGKVTGVRYQRHGETHEVSCKLVIDGSGRANVLAKKLDLRMDLVELKSFSVFAHHKGAVRDEGDAEGNVRLIFAEDMWFWWAPLKGDKSSVGIVADRGRFYGEYLKDPAAYYDKYIKTCDFIWKRMGDAERITGFRPVKKGESAVYTNYHYTTKEMLGEGWAMTGDSFGFIDPIFSAGLFVAQTSAMWLADEIIAAAKDGDLSKDRLMPYKRRYDDEFRQVMKHIQAYATDYFRPEFVNFYLGLANRHPRIRQMYIDTFVAYDKAAIIEYSRIIEQYFEKLRTPMSA